MEQARRHVEERILNTSCPRCGTVFLEFDGCAALRCRACPCAFCAWCLQVRASSPNPKQCAQRRPGGGGCCRCWACLVGLLPAQDALSAAP